MSGEPENYGNVDPVTRARVGSLAAHGLADQAIADLLLLSMEQVTLVKTSPEYKNKYAAEADEIITRQVEMDEGWDVVEQKSLAAIITALDYNRDPKYALFAAQAANRAKRRTREIESGGNSKTIINQQTENNVIMISVNKRYVEKVTAERNSPTIDVTPRQIENKPPLKTVDMPSPKDVDELLAPVRVQNKQRLLSEIEQAFKNADVSMTEYNE